MVVKNMGPRIPQTCVWILALPLPRCKTLHIISPLWVSGSSSENRDDDEQYLPLRKVVRIGSPWPRVITQQLLALTIVVVAINQVEQKPTRLKSKSKSSVTDRIRGWKSVRKLVWRRKTMWGFWGEGCPPRQRRSGPWCEWASPVQLIAVSTSNPCHFEFMTSMPHLYTLVQSSFCRKDPSWSLSSWSAFPARLTQLSPSLSNSLCKAPPTPSHSFLVTPMNWTHSSVITFNTLHDSPHLAFYVWSS